MTYFKRQYKLRKFIQLIKEILSYNDLATDRVQKNSFFERVKNIYFSKDDPLNDKNNLAVFPKATKNFNDSLANGHNIDSMKNNLGDFLKSEFDDYFDDLVDKKVLIPNTDNPPAYRLNHNSAMVYWIIGVGIILSFLWELFEIFFSKS